MSQKENRASDLQHPNTGEKRKAKESTDLQIHEKKFRVGLTDISNLCDDLLINIFSYLPKYDIFLNICNVCKHWSDLTKDEALYWIKIVVDTGIRNTVVYKWLSVAPLLEHIVIYDREKLYIILKKLEKTKNLQTLEILTPERRRSQHSLSHKAKNTDALCSLFQNHTKLSNIYIDDITVLFHDGHFFSVLKECISPNFKKWSYRGCISKWAFNDFLSFTYKTHNGEERNTIKGKFRSNRCKLEIVFHNEKLDFIF